MSALLYFILWAGLIFLMMRFGCGAHVMGRGHGHQDGSSPDDRARWTPPEKDVDPVCRMSVRTDSAKSSVYRGNVYYFCSAVTPSRRNQRVTSGHKRQVDHDTMEHHND